MWPPRCWTLWSTDIDPERPPEALSAGPADTADTLRRTSVSAPGGNLGAGRIYFARALKFQGMQATKRPEPRKKAMTPRSWLFCKGRFKWICPSPRDFQQTNPTGPLAGGAFAPHKRFRPRRKPWRRANSLRLSILISRGIQKNNHTFWCGYFFGASDEARTRYLHLGKVALYQMSYTRNNRVYISRFFPCCQLLFSISSTFFFPEHSRSSSARNSGSSSRGRYQ